MLHVISNAHLFLANNKFDLSVYVLALMRVCLYQRWSSKADECLHSPEKKTWTQLQIH